MTYEIRLPEMLDTAFIVKSEDGFAAVFESVISICWPAIFTATLVLESLMADQPGCNPRRPATPAD